jgi:hypothetical protein
MSLLTANPIFVQNHRPYQEDLFVNRQDEVEKITDKIRLLQAEQPVSQSVINYWGIEGIGKSWLLNFLKDKFSYSRNIIYNKIPTFAVLYNFRDMDAGDGLSRFARDVSSQVLEQLKSVLPSEAKPRLESANKSGNLEVLSDSILVLTKNFTPLILLDHADNVPAGTWDEIEKTLFEPIVTTGRVLIVVAGRRQMPRWKRFEVRRRLMEAHNSQIKPFDKQGVIRQVEKRHVPISADLLYPYTAGNPHIVDAFVQNIQEWTKDSEKVRIDKNWIEENKKSFLDVLQLSESELTRGVAGRLRQPLFAVVPLRFFRLEAMRHMLIGQNAKFKSEPEGYFLQLVRSLDQETEIVWWEREKRAYVTSEVVRKLINRSKYLEAPRDYEASHKQAFEMYQQWADDSPKTSDEFIIEMLFHHASICEVKNDAGCLRSEVDTILNFARANLSVERRDTLHKLIKDDIELLDLFPDEERAYLLEKVESLVNS